MVVIYHTLQSAGGERAITALPNGAAGVDLFFVISGFVMMQSSRRLANDRHGARLFLQRRLMRLIPLYWLLTAAKYTITALAPGLTPQTRPDAWNAVASLLFIPARDLSGQIRPVLPVGWSLNFEMFLYMLFALALALRLSVWWVLPALIATAAVALAKTPAWPAPFSLANGLVLEFAAGMLVWLATRNRWLPRPRAAVSLLAMAAALLLVVPSAGPWRCLMWGTPAAAILLAALALEPRYGSRMPPAVRATGDASYAIYLVHPFIVPALAPHGPLCAVAAITLSLAAGLLVHAWVDMPIQIALRRPQQMAAYVA